MTTQAKLLYPRLFLRLWRSTMNTQRSQSRRRLSQYSGEFRLGDLSFHVLLPLPTSSMTVISADFLKFL